ncbi:MAG: type IV pilus biogenesis/stability protein PilW [Gammaproteobacteria bacterium]|nr:type IV pilus biogenesis/stability protein PilW [Gammaproteobacteria bacterium]
MNKQTFVAIMVLTLLVGCISTTTGPRKPRTSDADAAQANAALGLNYMQQGKLELAMDKLKRALKQDPEMAGAHATIAMLYGRMGDPDFAEKHYRRAMQLSPGDPDLQNNYGVFLCGRDRYEEAENWFLSAAGNGRYRTPEAALTNAGVCARNVPAAEKAEGFFRQALARNPGFSEALWQMADLSFERGNLMQARAFLERHMDNAKATPEALWLGVRMEQSLGHGDVARNYAVRLKTEFPTAVQTRMLLELEQNDGSD